MARGYLWGKLEEGGAGEGRRTGGCLLSAAAAAAAAKKKANPALSKARSDSMQAEEDAGWRVMERRWRAAGDECWR